MAAPGAQVGASLPVPRWHPVLWVREKATGLGWVLEKLLELLLALLTPTITTPIPPRVPRFRRPQLLFLFLGKLFDG